MEKRRSIGSKVMTGFCIAFCVVLFLWIACAALVELYAGFAFDKCEKKFDVEVVTVDVSRTKYKETSGADSYTVYAFRAHYKDAEAEYTTWSSHEDYEGKSEAVYLGGVVWWDGKEIEFSKLSVKNLPDYDEKKARDPHDAGARAINDAILNSSPVVFAIPVISLIAAMVFGMIGSILRSRSR